jgi:hypothetical protein
MLRYSSKAMDWTRKFVHTPTICHCDELANNSSELRELPAIG